MENLKSPISKMASALKIRSEGMGLRATGRVMGTHKNTISKWEDRFADQKEEILSNVVYGQDQAASFFTASPLTNLMPRMISAIRFGAFNLFQVRSAARQS